MKRREFIKWNAVAAAAAAVPASLSLFSGGGGLWRPPRAKSIVFLFMNGGPSQMELFDYKPELYKHQGKNVSGFFKSGIPKLDRGRLTAPITPFSQHGESGQWASHLIPEMSKLVDDITIIKSFVSKEENHTNAALDFLTGSPFPGQPYAGAWLDYGLNLPQRELPNSFIFTDPRGLVRIGNLGWGTFNLPKFHSSFVSSSVPNAHKLFDKLIHEQKESGDLFLNRFAELNKIAAEQRKDAEFSRARLEEFKTIFSMREPIKKIMNLDTVTEEEKKLYGYGNPHCQAFAEQLLVARRLVEKEVPFIQVYSGSDDESENWDAHLKLDDVVPMAKQVDRPIYGFIQDLKRRGLLDTTIVFWGGEFGRTPFVDVDRPTVTGRGHNIFSGTVWMAGGGIKKGFSYGETDELGWMASRDPVQMGDIWATMFYLMGVDHQQLSFQAENKSEMRLTRTHHRVLHEILT